MERRKISEAARNLSWKDIANVALTQIKEKNYDADLLAKGIPAEKIRYYEFAFRGKEVLMVSH